MVTKSQLERKRYKKPKSELRKISSTNSKMQTSDFQQSLGSGFIRQTRSWRINCRRKPEELPERKLSELTRKRKEGKQKIEERRS